MEGSKCYHMFMKTYDAARDLKRIRSFFEKSQSALGEELRLSKSNILRIENGQVFPRPATLEAIYSYSYGQGLDLNKEKARFYEEGKGGNVLLFHGARGEIIGEVDNKHSLPPNDFGNGFYLGTSLKQGATWVAASPSSSVYCFYFAPRGELRKKEFSVDREWMYAILYYRGAFQDKKIPAEVRKIVEEAEKLDYLIAPIADNKMYEILGDFMKGEITDEACLHALSMTDLGKQHVLKSEKAIASLRFVDRLYLCQEEKRNYLKVKAKEDGESLNKVRMSLLEYRRKGKFIDELFEED